MKRTEALQLSYNRDSQRHRCEFCNRLKADQEDSDLFDKMEDGPRGGERPDLCWSIEDDHVCEEWEEFLMAAQQLHAYGTKKHELCDAIYRTLRGQ